MAAVCTYMDCVRMWTAPERAGCVRIWAATTVCVYGLRCSEPAVYVYILGEEYIYTGARSPDVAAASAGTFECALPNQD